MSLQYSKGPEDEETDSHERDREDDREIDAIEAQGYPERGDEEE